MWQYNNAEELYHVGILGMHWGKRKAQVSNLKKAKLDYNSKVDKEYGNYDRNMRNIEKPYKKGQNLSKKDQQRELDNDHNYQKKVDSYKSEYDNQRSTIKSNIKNKYKELQKETSFGEKLLFNNATRKLAAKNMVDKNMSKEEAITSARITAGRNTVLLSLAAIGTMYLVNKR